MGIVCMGRHVQLAQPVAIKFLRRALSGRPSIVQRFLNEARAVTNLIGNGVATVVVARWEGQLDLNRARAALNRESADELEDLQPIGHPTIESASGCEASVR